MAESNEEVLKTLNAIWAKGRGTPTLTLLAGGTTKTSYIGQGTITLSQPVDKFDEICVISGDDSRAHIACRTFPAKYWVKGLSTAKSVNKNCFELAARRQSYYWWLDAKKSTSSSLVPWASEGENSVIFAIYGIKYS